MPAENMSNENSLTRRAFVASVGAVGTTLLAAAPSGAGEAQRVRLALLGAAHIHTPLFLRMLQTRDDVDIVHVWDRDAARAQKAAADGNAQTARTVADVLADRAVTGVVILSETSLHAELAIAAAEAGKHIFVEKPLTAEADQAFRIAEAIDKAGVLFSTGYHLRSAARNILVREHIRQGNFGRIVRVHASFGNDSVLQGAFDEEHTWTVQRRWGGLGSLADIGTHALDLLMWLVGDVESVAADLRSITDRYPECDETGQAILRFRAGMTGTIAGGWLEPANPVSLLVSGTEGHAVVLNDRLYLRSPKIEGADGARPWSKMAPPLDHPLLLFVDAVAGQPDVPLVRAHEAAARVQVMQAVYRAAREQRWVAVEAG